MTTSISVDAVVVAAPGMLSSRMDTEAVLLELEKGTYYGLDEVAARAWELLQKPVVVSSIRDVLVEEYDVDAATCQADLLSFLEKLQQEGLIEVDPANR